VLLRGSDADWALPEVHVCVRERCQAFLTDATALADQIGGGSDNDDGGGSRSNGGGGGENSPAPEFFCDVGKAGLPYEVGAPLIDPKTKHIKCNIF